MQTCLYESVHVRRVLHLVLALGGHPRSAGCKLHVRSAIDHGTQATLVGFIAATEQLAVVICSLPLLMLLAAAVSLSKSCCCKGCAAMRELQGRGILMNLQGFAHVI